MIVNKMSNRGFLFTNMHLINVLTLIMKKIIIIKNKKEIFKEKNSISIGVNKKLENRLVYD